MNVEKGSGNIKEQVLTKCWQYLFENFHKFNETNKIKIAIALSTKNLPQEITGEFKITEMRTIEIIKEDKTNRMLEYRLG